MDFDFSKLIESGGIVAVAAMFLKFIYNDTRHTHQYLQRIIDLLEERLPKR